MEDPDFAKQNDRDSAARPLTDIPTKLLKQGFDVPPRQGAAYGTGEDQLKSALVLPLHSSMVLYFGTICRFRSTDCWIRITLAITWPPGVLAEVESLSAAAQVNGNVIQQQPAAPMIDINYSNTAFPVGITEHSQQGNESTSEHLPICLAYRTADGTTLRDQLIAMAAGNARRSPCERFLGPSILDPNGVPCPPNAPDQKRA